MTLKRFGTSYKKCKCHQYEQYLFFHEFDSCLFIFQGNDQNYLKMNFQLTLSRRSSYQDVMGHSLKFNPELSIPYLGENIKYNLTMSILQIQIIILLLIAVLVNLVKLNFAPIIWDIFLDGSNFYQCSDALRVNTDLKKNKV